MIAKLNQKSTVIMCKWQFMQKLVYLMPYEQYHRDNDGYLQFLQITTQINLERVYGNANYFCIRYFISIPSLLYKKYIFGFCKQLNYINTIYTICIFLWILLLPKLTYWTKVVWPFRDLHSHFQNNCIIGLMNLPQFKHIFKLRINKYLFMKFLATVTLAALAFTSQAIRFNDQPHLQATSQPTPLNSTTTSTTTTTTTSVPVPLPALVNPVLPIAVPVNVTTTTNGTTTVSPIKPDDDDEQQSENTPAQQPPAQQPNSTATTPSTPSTPITPIALPTVVNPISTANSTQPGQPTVQPAVQPAAQAASTNDWSDQDQKQFSEWQKKVVPVTIPSLQADFQAAIQNEKARRKNKKNGGKN